MNLFNMLPVLKGWRATGEASLGHITVNAGETVELGRTTSPGWSVGALLSTNYIPTLQLVMTTISETGIVGKISLIPFFINKWGLTSPGAGPLGMWLPVYNMAGDLIVMASAPPFPLPNRSPRPNDIAAKLEVVAPGAADVTVNEWSWARYEIHDMDAFKKSLKDILSRHD